MKEEKTAKIRLYEGHMYRDDCTEPCFIVEATSDDPVLFKRIRLGHFQIKDHFILDKLFENTPEYRPQIERLAFDVAHNEAECRQKLYSAAKNDGEQISREYRGMGIDITEMLDETEFAIWTAKPKALKFNESDEDSAPRIRIE